MAGRGYEGSKGGGNPAALIIEDMLGQTTFWPSIFIEEKGIETGVTK